MHTVHSHALHLSVCMLSQKLLSYTNQHMLGKLLTASCEEMAEVQRGKQHITWFSEMGTS